MVFVKVIRFGFELKVHRVFAVLKSFVWGHVVIATMLLTTAGFALNDANAQTRAGDSDALSVGVRTALSRTGGGRVLSAERISSGAMGMSRIKVVDPTGRLQVLIIEDSPGTTRQRSPFEPEEGRRGRFMRTVPDAPTVTRGIRKPRSGDVEN